MITEFNVINDITIKTNERIAIFGKTGSGKTFLGKNWLLPQYQKYVFWDIKHENNDVQHDYIVNSISELKKYILTHDKILYQPESPKLSEFNNACEIIFKTKDNTLFVDEASIITTPSIIQYWHNIIMTQGRSYGVGIINASQRPRAIHNNLISESEHIFIFNLNLETDIIKLRQQIGDAADEIRLLLKHHMLYYSVSANKSYIFKPINKYNIETNQVSKLELYKPSLDDYLKLID